MAAPTRSQPRTRTSGRTGRGLSNVSRQAAFFCYHSISSPGWPFLSVDPDDFERHLATLRRLGWASGGEAELEQLDLGTRLSQPTAFLSFDDGYVDNHTHALPLLRAYRAHAFVFVLPTFVDTGAPLCWAGVEDACAELPDVMRSMSWDMVGELAEAGMTIGSHTNSHHRLPRLGDEELRQELLDSRQRIVRRLGDCRTLAYPYGHADRRVRAAARDAGYRWAFTMPCGTRPATGPLAIPRVAIDHRDGSSRFALKLRPVARYLILSPLRGPVRRLAVRIRGT